MSERILLRVAEMAEAGAETRRYRLARADGAPLPPAPPGSHVALSLPSGIERQYSVVAATPQAWTIAIRREASGRGGSAWLHDQLAAGDTIAATPPRNDFPLDETAPATVLIGGGIGVTPLIAMAERLRTLNRDVTFHAAFRSRAGLLLGDELAAIPGLRLHFDEEAGGPLPIERIVREAPRGAHLYCCGPAAMIEAFRTAAEADGRDPATIHFEYFAAATPPADAPAPGSFVVELARSGLTLTVPPRKSILEVVRDAGILTPSVCEQGVCGACEVRVIEGTPDHMDAVLSPREKRAGDRMMICCSGALSDRLVLDL